jgi:hypothetical protein
MFSLIMSIRSRLGSEVAFSLNSLLVLSSEMNHRSNPRQGLELSLAVTTSGDLIGELLELWEETAFESDEDQDDVIIVDESDEKESTRKSQKPLTYRQLFRMIAQDVGELQAEVPSQWVPLTKTSITPRCPLAPVETVLQISTLIRNFSMSGQNEKALIARTDLVPIVLRIAGLPLWNVDESTGGSKTDRREDGRLQVNMSDSMSLRKDALEVLANLGLGVRLDNDDDATSIAIFDLLQFFLADAHHNDQLYFDLSSNIGEASRRDQDLYSPLAHYMNLALATFARLTTLDNNRLIFSRLADSERLYDLFLSLLTLLPFEEDHFILVRDLPGLRFAENLAMSLYNLAFLAPAAVKERWRSEPRVIKGLLRVVRRLASPVAQTSQPSDIFSVLIKRCILILHLLNDVGGISTSTGNAADNGMSSHVMMGGGTGGTERGGATKVTAWFGLGDFDEDDERHTMKCVPTESDRSSVFLPSQSKKDGLGNSNQSGLAVLAGEPSSLFQHQQLNSGVFGALVELIGFKRSK